MNNKIAVTVVSIEYGIEYDNLIKHISEFCIIEKMSISDYQINVNGHVKLSYEGLTKIELKFNTIVDYFDLSNNMLTSIENIPYNCYTIDLSNNDITSLEGIGTYLNACEEFNISNNDIISGGIGLLLVDGLKHIISHNNPMATWKEREDFKAFREEPFQKALSIIRKYLPKGKKSILECQQELIDDGLEQYATL